MSGNNVDWSQRNADDEEERPPWAHLMPSWWYKTPPEVRNLRAAFPHWAWSDPTFVKRFTDLTDDAPAGKEDSQQAESAAVGRVRQARPEGKGKLPTDKRVASGESGESSPDHEFLEGEEGANAWRKTKRL